MATELELSEEALDKLLGMMADRLVEQVRPTLAKRQRARAAERRAVEAAPNVTPLRRAG